MLKQAELWQLGEKSGAATFAPTPGLRQILGLCKNEQRRGRHSQWIDPTEGTEHSRGKACKLRVSTQAPAYACVFRVCQNMKTWKQDMEYNVCAQNCARIEMTKQIASQEGKSPAKIAGYSCIKQVLAQICTYCSHKGVAKSAFSAQAARTLEQR